MSREQRHVLMWVAAVLLAFAAGLWCGKSCANRSKGWGGMWGSESHERMLEQFSRKLSLNPQQREQVSAILEERRKQMRALHYQVRPQFDSMRAQTRDQIRKVLTPEQAAKYDALEAETDQRWQKIRDKYDSADQVKAQ